MAFSLFKKALVVLFLCLFMIGSMLPAISRSAKDMGRQGYTVDNGSGLMQGADGYSKNILNTGNVFSSCLKKYIGCSDDVPNMKRGSYPGYRGCRSWPDRDRDPGDLDTPFFNISTLAEYDQTAWGVTSADFNNDGLVDFAVSWATGPFNYSGISVFYNVGNGEFSEDVVYIFNYSYITDLDSGDYDGDGDVDLMFTYSEYVWYGGWPINVNGTVDLLENDGDGHFSNCRMVAWFGPGTPFGHENRINPGLTSADFDLDGDIDFLVGSGSGKVEFFKNNGTGNFTNNGVIYDYGYDSVNLDSADFNNDGYMDFIVVPDDYNGSGRIIGHVYLKLNNGSPDCFDSCPGEILAYLPPPMDETGGLIEGGLAALDYNNDGNMDFIYVHDNIVYLYVNKDGVYDPFYVCRLPDGPEGYTDNLIFGGLTMADFNGDGLDDLVVGGVQGFVRLFINNFTLADIVRPKGMHWYLFDDEEFRIFRYYDSSLVIGKVTVVARELEPLQRVEFYLDGKLMYTDWVTPYEWLWDKFSFGKHIVTAKAYDIDGNSVGQSKTLLWKFL